MQNSEIIIIGAGMAGLIAARELAKAGKKVLVLEARDRVGGRAMPLDHEKFGYNAEGGAEWLHGDATITKALVKEANLTLIAEGGEIWSTTSGQLELHNTFIKNNPTLRAKLEALEDDISIAKFLQDNFKDEKDADFKRLILRAVQAYDAADPNEISTVTLREEWLTKDTLTQLRHDNRLKEGYGALAEFLKNEAIKSGAEIKLDTQVTKIEMEEGGVLIHVTSKDIFLADKCIITLPISVLKEIELSPALQFKQEIAANIGFGNVIKVLIKFKSRWWEKATKHDLSKMAFLTTYEKFTTWWTQYPEISSVLTGWMAGPEALNYKNSSDEELLEMALDTLGRLFKVDKDFLKKEIEHSEVVNWTRDPFTKGAYSYTKVNRQEAYEELAKPVDNKIFFAGEAVYSGEATATVEGALGSGKEVAQKILEGLTK